MTPLSYFIMLVFFLIIGFFIWDSGVFKKKTTKKTYQFQNGIETLDVIGIEILKYTNEYRIALGLSPLKCDKKLNKFARYRVGRMEFEAIVSHSGFAEVAMEIALAGGEIIAENIAFGFNTSKVVVKQWVKSEAHKANIVGDFNYIGIGVKRGRNNRFYYCQIFTK